MVDLSNKESSDSSESNGNEIKRCADCGTSKTPLWRSGPAGPKSLCNACGIRSSKKKRSTTILRLKQEDKRSKKINHNNTTSSKLSGGTSLHQRLIALGREVMMQRSTVDNKFQRRKLGEEEQAAVLLMALSYGSVYA